MKTSRNFILILFCIYGLIACSKSEHSKVPTSLNTKLTSDSTKLGLRGEAGGLSYRIPQNWQTTDSSMISTLKLIATKEMGKFRLTPQSVYQNSTSGSFLTISTFSENPKANENFTSWGRGFVDDYKLNHSKAKIKEEWLALAGLPTVQLIHEDSVSVHCLFVIQGTSPIEFGYTIPLQNWADEKKAVESSAASIKKL